MWGDEDAIERAGGAAQMIAGHCSEYVVTVKGVARRRKSRHDTEVAGQWKRSQAPIYARTSGRRTGLKTSETSPPCRIHTRERYSSPRAAAALLRTNRIMIRQHTASHRSNLKTGLVHLPP